MGGMNIQGMTSTGIVVGLGIAVIPAAVTSLIACSKIILINIIADGIIRILTANAYTLSIYGISVVQVPLLWKISLVAAKVGVTIFTLSLVAALTNAFYKRYVAQN